MTDSPGEVGLNRSGVRILALCAAIAMAGWTAAPALAQSTDRPSGTAAEPPVQRQPSSQQPLSLVPPQAARPGPTEPSIPKVRIPDSPVTGIEVNPLTEVAPDAVGTLARDDGGFGEDMWEGTDRRVVVGLLRRLPTRLESPVLRDLARRLLLSIAMPPVSRTVEARPAEASQPSLLTLRVARLRELGEIPGLNALLAAVPSRAETESIAKSRLEGLLLAHRYDEACKAARTGVAEYSAPYWQKAMVFCHLLAGAPDRAMLGLDLLREQGATADDPMFMALAGALTGLSAEPVPAPPDGESLSPLNLAVLLQTGEALPDWIESNRDPAILRALATAPGLDPARRLAVAEPACGAGLIDGALLAEVYAAQHFPDDALADPLGAAAGLEGRAARALLYQATAREGLPATRAEILRVAFQRATEDGAYVAAAQAYLPLVADLPVGAELAWFAPTAGRVLYAAGRFEQAGAWLALGRQEALVNPQATSVVAALWPYSRIAGGPSVTTESNLAAWRAVREGVGEQAVVRRQALLRAIFQALGEQDPLPWVTIAADGEPVSRPLPSAALLYALEDAMEARRIGETVALSLILLGERGPAESHTVALSAVLSALVRVGLQPEARALAIEAALANGI